VLVFVDSVLLLAGVVTRRAHDLGLLHALRAVPASRRPVLYVDCGVHKLGEQLRWMRTWFGDRCDLQMVGFEASEEHYLDAGKNLADVEQLDLRHLALVGPDAGVTSVKLYKGARSGKADSLYAHGRSTFEIVPAARLSDLLSTEYTSALGAAPVLLRMNIEGSEYDVVDDLVRSGVSQQIDGYFGMWDDVAKLDAERDAAFRRMLDDAGITHVTFNDRDLRHPMRRFAVRLAVDHAIRRGFADKHDRQPARST